MIYTMHVETKIEYELALWLNQNDISFRVKGDDSGKAYKVVGIKDARLTFDGFDGHMFQCSANFYCRLVEPKKKRSIRSIQEIVEELSKGPSPEEVKREQARLMQEMRAVQTETRAWMVKLSRLWRR